MTDLEAIEYLELAMARLLQEHAPHDIINLLLELRDRLVERQGRHALAKTAGVNP
ncbi:MAG: hypothetical protein JOY61_03430 [Chloroflexi bacterium]|nr:hypothetical protein [Chloroflexota bacterium]